MSETAQFPIPSSDLEGIVEFAENIFKDSELTAIANHRAAGGRVVGCAPAYVPTEIIEASGALPAYLLGAGPSLEVVQGDAYFQSAICHIPRSLVELGLRGSLDGLDLMVIPSTCDVMRNLTGMWQMLWPKTPVFFMDLPQRYDEIGFEFYRQELSRLRDVVSKAVGVSISDDALREVIVLHNDRRALLAELEELRVAEPWRIVTSELWLVIRAGSVLPVKQHLELLGSYLEAARKAHRPTLDVARVVLTGAFCEQPPLGFIRTLERAGCALVADDMLLGMRWLRKPVDTEGDPLDAIARAYLSGSPLAPCRFEGDQRRPDEILKLVRERRASGVIYATPSFCDPPLLDRPGILQILDRESVPCVQLQYAENSVDFGSVREQAGTFADALRLWEAS